MGKIHDGIALATFSVGVLQHGISRLEMHRGRTLRSALCARRYSDAREIAAGNPFITRRVF